MAFTIAPANSGSELGMAQMRYGLHNSANYNATSSYTAAATGMRELVSGSTTYQGDLSSKTWNVAQPYGFDEMYGQTWDAGFTMYVSQQNTDNCGKGTGTVYNGEVLEATFSKNSDAFPTIDNNNFEASSTDIISVFVTAQTPTGAGCLENFNGTDVSIQTGPSLGSLTTRKIVSSLGSDSYSFTASLSEAYINIVYTPTA